tara:strand:- start:99 stop:647 length:549 start_codon:yes stop_codon:yes gene_type:complete
MSFWRTGADPRFVEHDGEHYFYPGRSSKAYPINSNQFESGSRAKGGFDRRFTGLVILIAICCGLASTFWGLSETTVTVVAGASILLVFVVRYFSFARKFMRAEPVHKPRTKNERLSAISDHFAGWMLIWGMVVFGLGSVAGVYAIVASGLSWATAIFAAFQLVGLLGMVRLARFRWLKRIDG